MKKCLTVFSGELAMQLVNKGYQVQSIAQDKKYTDHVVYFFENKPEVQQTIKYYTAKKCKMECATNGNNSDKRDTKENI